MKRWIVMAIMAGLSMLASGAQLRRVASDAITLRGAIAEGDVDKLRQLVTPGISVLRVNSDGGDPQAAMLLGRYLRQLQWGLAVLGVSGRTIERESGKCAR